MLELSTCESWTTMPHFLLEGAIPMDGIRIQTTAPLM